MLQERLQPPPLVQPIDTCLPLVAQYVVVLIEHLLVSVQELEMMSWSIRQDPPPPVACPWTVVLPWLLLRSPQGSTFQLGLPLPVAAAIPEPARCRD